MLLLLLDMHKNAVTHMHTEGESNSRKKSLKTVFVVGGKGLDTYIPVHIRGNDLYTSSCFFKSFPVVAKVQGFKRCQDV